MNECEAKIIDVTQTYEAKLKTANDTIVTLQKTVDATKDASTTVTKTLEAQLKDLKDWRDARVKADHDALAEEVISLEAGMRTVSDAEKATVRGYPAETLAALKATLSGVKSIVDERPAVTGPKVPLFSAEKDGKIGFSAAKRILTGAYS